MKDFFGVDYVESRWTRFVFVWQSIDFESKRNAAFSKWADNVAAALKRKYADAEMLISIGPNYGGDIVRANIRIPSISKTEFVELGLIHYDTLTKRGLDPVKYVLSNLKWWADNPRMED